MNSQTQITAARPLHAAADHPEVMPRKVGVVIANLGTPDGTDYWSMRRYLNEFLSDRRVIDYSAWLWQPLLQLVILTKRPFTSGEAYAGIWNEELDESPLLTVTREQCRLMEAELRAIYGDRVEVDFCMRYGNPSTPSVLKAMQAKGCDRIVFFPLYPQYAAPTTATANDQAFRALMDMNWQPAFRTVPAYFDDPAYIATLAASIEEGYAATPSKPDVLVASYHGVPKRYLMDGDPYHCQCQKTTRLLREHLGWKKEDIITAFQSKFGPEEWVGPATVDLVADLAKAGKKHIAVVAPAFSTDCVETLEEIDEEIKESFEEAGGEAFTYIPCLNDRPDHISVLTGIVQRELSGWL